MPKASPALASKRKKEIMNACRELYKTLNFKEITIKEIANYTSFTRPSIYNYFQTKEEIFLEVFKEEYDLWSDDLTALIETKTQFTTAELSQQIARSLEKRTLLLKLLSVNLYDMEETSSLERLTEFKRSYRRSIEAFKALLRRHCTSLSDGDITELTVTFFELMHGIYPYAHVTEKQAKAMDAAGIVRDKKTIYEHTLIGLERLLGE
ncbi:MAG: TetR/AcrR family transcriptional regulator [Ruminococcaceae bacterium]|nr:TetR/AcrR family transcriptional regulator [Oscillospiraceae bacterium]